MDARIVTDERALAEHLPAWDALAVAAGRPACAPGWGLAWWAAAAPPGAELAVALAHDGQGLAGVVGAYAERRRGRPARLKLLAAPMSARVEPLARPGTEGAAATALAGALAGTGAGALHLDGVDGRIPWARLLAAAWPGGAALHQVREGVAPRVDVAAGAEAWLASRSSNFRSQMRRARRQLEGAGATLRQAVTDEDVARGLDALARLHEARWEERGGSGALSPGVEAALAEAARRLPRGDRYRLWIAEAEGAIVSAHLFLAAGAEVTYWMGGHDDGWGRMKPSLVTILAALEEAAGRGEPRFDLGYGDHDYKHRFTDQHDELAWWVLLPRGARGLPARAELAALDARRVAKARMPDEVRERLKALRRR